MTIEIRTARPQDADALAKLATRTFRAAFADQNTSEDMEAYIRQQLSADQVAKELAEGANTFLLAVDGEGALVGYAKLRSDRVEPCVEGPAPIEIERLYVDTAAIGTGLGATLMKACLDWSVASQFETIWLGVWEQNERALRFYRRWGFEVVGSHVFRLGSDDQIDLIMERPVRGETHLR